MNEKFFPIVLIFLQLAAAIPYGASGNFRMMIYWVAAAILNIAVTF